MKTSIISKEKLESLSNLEWFDKMCEILKVQNQPTTRQLIELMGKEDQEIKRSNRGSKFLIPYDKRFHHACINPDLLEEESDQPLSFFSVIGPRFNIKFKDIAKRFPSYTTRQNTYDGGTQIFFNPVPDHFEFAGIGLWTELEPREIVEINELEFNSVTFYFGKKKALYRDGYSMEK